VRFLVDAQLPPALARALAGQGHQAEHLEDIGLRHAEDQAVWDYAVRNEAVLLTKDDDFVDHYRRRSGGPVVVWLRIGNSSKKALLAWFLPSLPAILTRIESGDRLIEVR